MKLLELKDIQIANNRIHNFVKKTPILMSTQLNQRLGHNIFFKAECLQKIGAFKARGAINTLLWLKENNQLPEKIVPYSSGNHA